MPIRGVCVKNLGGIRALRAWEKIPKVMILGDFNYLNFIIYYYYYSYVFAGGAIY